MSIDKLHFDSRDFGLRRLRGVNIILFTDVQAYISFQSVSMKLQDIQSSRREGTLTRLGSRILSNNTLYLSPFSYKLSQVHAMISPRKCKTPNYTKPNAVSNLPYPELDILFYKSITISPSSSTSTLPLSNSNITSDRRVYLKPAVTSSPEWISRLCWKIRTRPILGSTSKLRFLSAE